MTVELEGEPGEHGMVMDFKHLKRLLAPLVDEWDHSTLVAEDDKELMDALKGLGSRYSVLPFDSTCENLCCYVTDYLLEEGETTLIDHGIQIVRVRIQETETSFAEVERPVVPSSLPVDDEPAPAHTSL